MFLCRRSSLFARSRFRERFGLVVVRPQTAYCQQVGSGPVSYTHLTLPTIYSV